MILAAGEERQAGIGKGPTHARLFVATRAEAVPLLGYHPTVTGMGRRRYDLAGCKGVISAGFSGACQPDLRPGNVLLTRHASRELRSAVGSIEGALQTIDHVASPAEKAVFGAQGVAAVDMETAWLDSAAAEAGLPFLGIRVIIDRVADRPCGPATAWHYPKAALALRRAVRLALSQWP